MSFPGAEDVIGSVGVDVSVSGSIGIAPSTGEEFVGSGVEVSVSERWSDEMVGTDIAHHVLGFLMVVVIPEVGVSGDTTLAPSSTVVVGGLPGESVSES